MKKIKEQDGCNTLGDAKGAIDAVFDIQTQKEKVLMRSRTS